MIRYAFALVAVMTVTAAAGAGSVLAIWAVANVPLWMTMGVAANAGAIGGLYWGAAYLNGSE